MDNSNPNPKADPLFIPDGETRTAYIKAMAGEHPAVRLTYRRVTALNLPQLGTNFGEITEAQIRAMADCLCSKIIGLCTVGADHQNEPVEAGFDSEGKLLPDKLLGVSPYLFRRVQAIVTGLGKSDPDPLDQSQQGTAEHDQKNSKAGSGSFTGTPKLQPEIAGTAGNSDTTKVPALL